MNLSCPPTKDPLFVFDQLTVNDKLSQNAATSIIQTKDGYILIGTYDGLNIFDGFTIKTKHHSTVNKNSLINNRIISLYEDNQGLIWISTEDGLSLYDLRNDVFKDISKIEKLLPSSEVKCVNTDVLGNVWIGTKSGLLVLEKGDLSKINLIESFQGKNITSIAKDKSNNLWVSSLSGLFLLPTKASISEMVMGKQEIEQFRDKKLNIVFCDSLNNIWIGGENELLYLTYKFQNNQYKFNISDRRKLLTNRKFVSIFSIAQGRGGDLWFGCKTSGLYHVELDRNANFKRIIYFDDSETFGALANNDIRSVLIDRSNVLWIGTKKGVNYVDLNPPLFYTHKPLLSNNRDKYGYKGTAIQSVFVDSHNTLWVGGLMGYVHTYDFCSHKVKNVPIEGTVFQILESKKGDIWILSSQKVLKISKTNIDRRSYFTENIPISKLLYKPNIGWMLFSMCEDKFGNIWIGANGEIVKFNGLTGQPTKYSSKDNIPTSIITYLYQDPYENSIWIGTKGAGAMRIKYNGQDDKIDLQRLVYNPNEKKNIIFSNYIWTFYRDVNKNLWLGTDAGLGKLELNTKNQITGFTFVRDLELADLKIVAINEDQNTRLWLNGSQGLYSYDYRSGRVQHFTYEDGLQSNTFTEASFISNDGWLFVGGINGLNYFNTNELFYNKYLSTPIISDFRIFNKAINVGEKVDGEIILNKSLNLSPLIELNYKQNNFSIAFSSDHFASVSKKKYRYKLDGYDRDWVETESSQRVANYSNLPSGTYKFRLISSNNHMLWNDVEKTLTISILPPPWKTWWAYLLYALVILIILFTIFRYFNLRELWRRNINVERIEKEKAQELAKIKERFFTNITHELRTPLLLISEPLKDLMTNTDKKDHFSNLRLNVIDRNSKRLLTLINQLLDVRRLMNQDLPLNTTENNLSKHVIEIFKSFEHKATKSGIKLDLIQPKYDIHGWYDKDKIEKVIINLISNAFKHTLDGGFITVAICQNEGNENIRNAVIKISDNGSGISDQDKLYIFDMFYRGDKRDNISSGIGLAFVKVLLEAHKGSINVDSKLGIGSTFTVQFPINKKLIQMLFNLLISTIWMKILRLIYPKMKFIT